MTKKEKFHDMTGKSIYHKEEFNPLCVECRKLCKQKKSATILECPLRDPLPKEDK